MPQPKPWDTNEPITNLSFGTQFPNQPFPLLESPMSYAGPAGSRPAKNAGPRRPPARPAETTSDWHQLAIFGAGLALGIAVGAGVALLTAPQAGDESREDIKRYARRTSRMLGRRSQNAWLDLRDELRGASDALQRRRARRAERKALAREAHEAHIEVTDA